MLVRREKNQGTIQRPCRHSIGDRFFGPGRRSANRRPDFPQNFLHIVGESRDVLVDVQRDSFGFHSVSSRTSRCRAAEPYRRCIPPASPRYPLTSIFDSIFFPSPPPEPHFHSLCHRMPAAPTPRHVDSARKCT